jgi:hypothetical protein
MRLRRLWLAMLLGLCPLIAAAQEDDRVWAYRYLLVTAQTERELAPVAEHIVKDELPDTSLTDVVAEILLTRAADPAYPPENDIQLLKVLAAARSRRYDAALTRIAEIAKDAKVVSWAQAGKRRRFKRDEVAYVPGDTDLQAIVDEMRAAALSVKPTTAQGQHLAEFRGSTIEDLFAWAGRPQQIAGNRTSFTDGIITIKGDRLAFYYRGLGRVLFDFDRLQRDWVLKGIVVDPLAFEGEFATFDPAKLGMTQLVSGYTASMKNAVEINHRRGARTLEFMDTAAEILATRFRSSEDPAAIDMYSWICRLLTQHGGPRYAAILERVAKDTTDDKLQRFATLKIEPAPDVPATPYVPGTISLERLREQYPSPFPESTFQSGRL